MEQQPTPDVVVIGGGPIGLAAAIAARLQGLEVILLEPRRPPLDKACGEGIMPGGIDLLGELGVRIPPGESVPLAGIEFVEGCVRARARFPGRQGLGVRRTVLHAALARRAADLGADLRWGREGRALDGDAVGSGADRILARWVVGADGMNSPVRRALGLDSGPVHRRFGIRRHYAIEPWTDFVEVHWSRHGEAYVTPVGPDIVSIALLAGGAPARGRDRAVPGDRPPGGDAGSRFDEALARFPGLERRLRRGRPISEPMGSGTVFRKLPRVVRGRTALVGDASGSVDAISGEGLALGLRQAVLLARCLRGGDLGRYDREHRRLMRRANGMTSFLLAVGTRRRLRRLTLKGLSAFPSLFGLLLSVHTQGPSAGGSGLTWHPGGTR